MFTRTLRLLRFATALACLAFAQSAGCSGPPADVGPAPDAWVTIKDQRVAAEIARTPAEQSLGLGQRDSLDWGKGMLFVYPRSGFLSFWMKDMRFAIDIIWIRDGRIVEIAHQVPFSPEGPGPTLRPRELADSVLEVSAGYAAAHGWRYGDAVVVDTAASPPSGR